jgi:putative oxidoreductase
METAENFGALAGRILVALIFVLSGLLKLAHLGGVAAMMAAHGLPDPGGLHLLALAAVIVELGGGILLAIGFQARIVALILFLYLIPVTLLFHVIPGGQVNQVNALKNLAIMGGLLIVATQGGGGFSIDSARMRAA